MLYDSPDHAVFDTGDAIMKCGGRDDLRTEAWAMDRARGFGVPAPRVLAFSAENSFPYLIVARSQGEPLWSSRLSRANAERGARNAGRCLRTLHQIQLDGFGPPDAAQTTMRGRRSSWGDEVHTELEEALSLLDAKGALPSDVIAATRARYAEARRAIAAVERGSFLHGDIGRMHVYVDPTDGRVTDLIDWGDVTVGDPVWELAVAECHMTSPAEGHQGYTGGDGLFPHLLEGYRAHGQLAMRIEELLRFYCAHRFATVARRCFERMGFVPDQMTARLAALTKPTTN